MRTIYEDENRFEGTHKGGTIDIFWDGRPEGYGEGDGYGGWYIQVRWKDGGLLYDGWAPEAAVTMADAKKEACRGAGLDEQLSKRERKPKMLHGLPVPA